MDVKSSRCVCVECSVFVFGLNNNRYFKGMYIIYLFFYNRVFKTVPGKTRSTRVHPSVYTRYTCVLSVLVYYVWYYCTGTTFMYVH